MGGEGYPICASVVAGSPAAKWNGAAAPVRRVEAYE